MFHYLYKTTCLVTDKYYIGVHSTGNLYDGYLGSGLKLIRSVNAYGIDNHDRVWLEFFNSATEAFTREAEMVTQKLIDSDSQCMNLKPGGLGGFSSIAHGEKAQKAAVKQLEYLRETCPDWAIEGYKKLSTTMTLAYQEGTRVPVGWSNEASINAWSDEAYTKRKATWKESRFAQGSKNSQFGTCWVSNNVHTIKISIELLDEYISKGYIRGRKLNLSL